CLAYAAETWASASKFNRIKHLGNGRSRCSACCSTYSGSAESPNPSDDSRSCQIRILTQVNFLCLNFVECSRVLLKLFLTAVIHHLSFVLHLRYERISQKG